MRKLNSFRTVHNKILGWNPYAFQGPGNFQGPELLAGPGIFQGAWKFPGPLENSRILNFLNFVLESLFLALNLGGEEGGRDGCRRQSEEFLEKFQKEEGEHFQSKNLYSRFWTFKPGFLSMK